MNSQDFEEWERRLTDEILGLRAELGRKEEELVHVSGILRLMRQDGERQAAHLNGSLDPRRQNDENQAISLPRRVVPVLHKQSGGRHSIVEIRPDYFEYEGQRFGSVVAFLDFVGERNYFSKDPLLANRGDAAQRKIITWGRRNPVLANRLWVILEDESRFTLKEILDHME